MTFSVSAQGELDSLLQDESIDYSILSEDSLLLDELGSLSIFDLLDSILNTDFRKSQLAFRIGFTSDVVNAGRDLGANQQGLTPGISYYHKSGFYASALGYWNSQFDPKYNLTVLSTGYFGMIKNKLTYSGSYERTIYHESDSEDDIVIDDVSNPFTNNIGLGLSYDFKYLYSGIDYSLLFGDDVTHRLRWSVTGYLKKKNFLFFDYVLFTPDFSLLFGREDITFTTLTIFQRLRERGFTKQSFRQLDRSVRERILNNIRSDEGLVFGLMNYGFSFPITFRKGPWSYTMSYNYNIPIELPGEEISLSSSGYFGTSLTYYLGF